MVVIASISESQYKNIGRYGDDYIIFNVEVHPLWSKNEINEYYKNNSGLYRNWSYDLTSRKIRKQLFDWIDEIPNDKRSKLEVIRYLMSKMSSLMVGNWSNNFDEGLTPTHWIGTEQIFIFREKINHPVKYGQCWCFSEIMTSLCRMLNIPTRTVSGKNVLIDENLDHGIDFKEDLKKGESGVNMSLIGRDFLNQTLSNLVSGGNDKGELWDELKIFDCGDTYWSFHYWNEVFINGSWYAFDSTPTTINLSGIGPYSISKEDGFDSDKILSMVNLPFRLWATETIIEGDKAVNIPYVYSIIYPHSINKSKYLKLPKIKSLFDKKIRIITKNTDFPKHENVDITDNYLLSDSKLSDLYYRNSPLEGNFYIQIVHLDSIGNVLHIDRITSLNSNMKDKESIIKGTYMKSYLLIEIVTKGQPKWLTFCKYC